MSKPKFHIKKGDSVTVTSGAHKGKSGIVIQVLPTKSQALVEGVRMIKKAMKRTQENQQGGIIEREGPIHVSNLRLVEEKKTEKKTSAKKAAKPAKQKAAKAKK